MEVIAIHLVPGVLCSTLTYDDVGASATAAQGSSATLRCVQQGQGRFV